MVDVGYVKAQSDNLPKVDTLMVVDFFNKNADYASVEIRGAKLKRSGRESYGDDAVGYVQVKRNGNICYVKAKITPEHKVRNKGYKCTLVCNEIKEEIVSVQCEDCAANKGGCKHAVAFLMWVHRRSEEPSTTDTKCYWAKSRLANVGTSEKFIKAKDIGSTSRNAATQLEHFIEGNFLSDVVTNLKEGQCQLMNYFGCHTATAISMHYLMHKFKEQPSPHTADTFLCFCATQMTIKECRKIERATAAQANSPLWYEMRYCRITASKAHESAQCKTTDGVLVEQIFGALKIKETAAMSRGKRLEKDVLSKISIKKEEKIKTCGIFLRSDWPVLGATPDGMTNEAVVEIKCPTSEKTKQKYVNNGLLTNKYKAQIQLQMFFTGKKKGYFCIASENFEENGEIDVYDVVYDEEYCINLLEKCTDFWKNCIFDKLVV